MKNSEVKKSWNGRISLRDYIVETQIRKKEPVRVLYKSDQMILSPEQLEKRDYMTECISRYTGKKYKLYDYVWKPQDNRQGELI